MAVRVGVPVGIGTAVFVGAENGIAVRVAVGTAVLVAVGRGVRVANAMGVLVGDGNAVALGVGTIVALGVGTGVRLGAGIAVGAPDGKAVGVVIAIEGSPAGSDTVAVGGTAVGSGSSPPPQATAARTRIANPLIVTRRVKCPSLLAAYSLYRSGAGMD